MAIPRKGLREIRTLSGRVDRVALPYKAYMQITCLEMEKLRRSSEKSSAGQRVANLDARLQEIEVEKEALLQSVGERTCNKPINAPSTQPKHVSHRSTGGFKVRY